MNPVTRPPKRQARAFMNGLASLATDFYPDCLKSVQEIGKIYLPRTECLKTRSASVSSP